MGVSARVVVEAFEVVSASCGVMRRQNLSAPWGAHMLAEVCLEWATVGARVRRAEARWRVRGEEVCSMVRLGLRGSKRVGFIERFCGAGRVAVSVVFGA